MCWRVSERYLKCKAQQLGRVVRRNPASFSVGTVLRACVSGDRPGSSQVPVWLDCRYMTSGKLSCLSLSGCLLVCKVESVMVFTDGIGKE